MSFPGWILIQLDDLVLCKFNISAWLQKVLVEGFLVLGTSLFGVLLTWGIDTDRWFLILPGAAGVIYFLTAACKFAFWWVREGRHGAPLPWRIKDIHSKADITSPVSEEDLRRMDPPDVRRDWHNRL